MTTYVIGKATYPERVSVYEGREPKPVFVPDLSFGEHPSVREAKRAFVRVMEPSLADASDAFITQWCRPFFTNLKHFKVLKRP